MRSAVIFLVSFLISFTLSQLAMRAYASTREQACDQVVIEITRSDGGVISSQTVTVCPLDGGHLK